MRVGLALSGGGALGIAHLAVLEALESAGITVDVVCGSSAGGIVGLLYATGGTEYVARFFSELKEYSVLSPKNLLKIRNPAGYFALIETLLRDITKVTSFDQLGLEWSCTATDIETGKNTLLYSGDPVQCALATSAYPGVFPMQKVGDRHYIDGAVSLTMPVTPLRDQGADFVIGSSVYCLSKLNHEIEKLNTWQIATRTLDIMQNQINAYQINEADFVFAPPLTGYTWYQFSEFDNILAITRPYVQQKMHELVSHYRSCLLDSKTVSPEQTQA